MNNSANIQEKVTARRIKLLGSPVRLRILHLLDAGASLSVKEVAECLQMSQPATTHQLLKLSNAGFLEVREAGTWHYYSAKQENIAAVLREAALYLGLVEAS